MASSKPEPSSSPAKPAARPQVPRRAPRMVPLWDRRQAWDRLPGEGKAAYEAFLTYLELSPTARASAQAVAQACGRTLPMLRKWARTHDWRDRAALWDGAEGRPTVADQRLVMAATDRTWLARAVQLREAEYRAGLRMLDRVQQLLAVVKVPRTAAPAEVLPLLARLGEVGSLLMRRAAALPVAYAESDATHTLQDMAAPVQVFVTLFDPKGAAAAAPRPAEPVVPPALPPGNGDGNGNGNGHAAPDAPLDIRADALLAPPRGRNGNGSSPTAP